ncbi:MAG: hypothetical protein WA642_24845 [Steroidobacteraceae bacterium]
MVRQSRVIGQQPGDAALAASLSIVAGGSIESLSHHHFSIFLGFFVFFEIGVFNPAHGRPQWSLAGGRLYVAILSSIFKPVEDLLLNGHLLEPPNRLTGKSPLQCYQLERFAFGGIGFGAAFDPATLSGVCVLNSARLAVQEHRLAIPALSAACVK